MQLSSCQSVSLLVSVLHLQGAGRGRRRRWRRIGFPHALGAALHSWGQLTVTISPAAFTDEAASELALFHFTQLAQVLRTHAVLPSQLVLHLTRTLRGLLDDGSQATRFPSRLILLQVKCAGARLVVLSRILQCLFFPWEVKIKEGTLGAESTHCSCISSDEEWRRGCWEKEKKAGKARSK